MFRSAEWYQIQGDEKGGAWLLPQSALYKVSRARALTVTVATLGPAPSKEQDPRLEGFSRHGGRQQHPTMGMGSAPPQAA